jgi:hypothetical protein
MELMVDSLTELPSASFFSAKAVQTTEIAAYLDNTDITGTRRKLVPAAS